MSLSNVFFTIVRPSDEITTPFPFPSINHRETFAQSRVGKDCSNIFGQARRPAPTKACRGDSLWSPVSTKYDFDAVLSKEMPGSDTEVWHFSEEMPGSDTEFWHFSKEMPGSDTEVWHFSKEMPVIDTEDRHFSREMHVFDIISLLFLKNPYRDLK